MVVRESLETAVGRVEARLGASPFYSAPGVRLFKGDCLDLLSKIDSPCFDLTVTSPPYNIGKEYEEISEIGDYLAWSERWIGEVFRTTLSTGAFWLNVGYVSLPERARAIPIPYLLWDRVPFFLVQEIVWNYGAGVAARTAFSPRNEKFLWYVKTPQSYTFNLDDIRDPDVKYPNQKKNGKLKCNPLGKNPTDVWQIPKVTSGRDRSSKERTPHPAQFPVALIERIVRACSNPGDLVLDPFAGSGSVAEVCLRTGRACVGIEMEPKYLKIAARRLDNVLAEIRDANAQRALFDLVED